MPKPRFSIIYEIIDLFRKTFIQFKRQKMLSAFSIVVVIILITILFTFLSFIQTISPFVYPLF